jgi:SNF2 family DNA or RNA helicase
MALRLDPVRLLIADDVGVGKTIEAGMIAHELLDRGIAKRLAVLTPAHLCDQWERELREKFSIETVLVQPSQMARLERERSRQDVWYYPNFVASIDFVKSDRGGHRDAFLRDAPDLIIVDEAHIAARPGGADGRLEHQRHELLRDLAKDPSRHVILVTATPHSGIEESFRSLLGLLDPDLEQQMDRKRLLPHVIQRRRQDVEKWLGSETPFPDRKSEERRYEQFGLTNAIARERGIAAYRAWLPLERIRPAHIAQEKWEGMYAWPANNKPPYPPLIHRVVRVVVAYLAVLLIFTTLLQAFTPFPALSWLGNMARMLTTRW